MAVCEVGVCDGSGWIEVDDMTAKPCACRAIKAKRKQSRRLGTGIPKRFRGVGFDRQPIADMDPTLIREIRSYVRDVSGNLDKGKGLWLFGDVGTGKTSLAMLVAKAADKAGRSIAVYSVPQLLATIRRTYESNSEDSYDALMRRLTGVDLLLLDDLGAERQTEWVLEQLYSIVNTRYEDQRSVVVTTNLQPDALGDQVGLRTVSRLIEMCGDPLPLFGADRRRSLPDLRPA